MNMYACMYVRMYVCMYVYHVIYMYVVAGAGSRFRPLPPSAGFTQAAAAPRASDRGQIDGGPRYDYLLADIIAFFRKDQGDVARSGQQKL